MIAEDYKSFLEKDKSIYRDLGYSAYYTYMKDRKKAVEYMKAFSSQDNVQYWLILFLEKDPMMEKISRYPEFKKYFGQVKERFWKAHDQLKDILYDQQLLP